MLSKLLNTMTGNLTPPGNMETKSENQPSEEKAESRQGDGTGSELVVSENASEEDSRKDRLQAWLCVLATFFLFFNAW